MVLLFFKPHVKADPSLSLVTDVVLASQSAGSGSFVVLLAARPGPVLSCAPLGVKREEAWGEGLHSESSRDCGTQSQDLIFS